MRVLRMLVAVGAAAVLLSGCGAGGDRDDSGRAWAAVIASTSAQASSPFERKVLADGEITDAEYSELQSRIVSCLAGLGLKASFDGDGALTYTQTRSTPVERDRIQACSADNGIRTLALRDAMVRNPAHLDEGEIMVDCLRRVHLVDSGYTARMYDEGADMERISASQLFDGCEADPLHYEK
jgi:hypothetical protein